MSGIDIDNGADEQAVRSEAHASPSSGEGSAGGQGQALPAFTVDEGGQQSVIQAMTGAATALPPMTLADQRKAKLNAVLSGSYDQKLPSMSAMPGGVSGYEVKKEEPWIGPDGGPIGRGIKRAGDAYQGYIDKRRDGLMETMREKMTPPDWAVDALATGGHGATTAFTGIDTGYEPKYPGNKVFQVGASFPKAVEGLLPRGFGGARSLINPLPAMVQGARWLGGEQVKPSEATRAAASMVQSGFNAVSGIGTQRTLQMQEAVEKGVEAFLESEKLVTGKP